MLAVFLFALFISLILGVGSFMYVIIMGPSRYHRDGYVGAAYRMLVSLPTLFCGCCCSLFLGCNQRRGQAKWKNCSTHAINEKNWYMVTFYIVLVWTVEFLYLFIALPRLKTALVWKLTSWGLVLISEWLYAKAIFADPGRVTSASEMNAQTKQFLHSEGIAGVGPKSVGPAGETVARKPAAAQQRRRGKKPNASPPPTAAAAKADKETASRTKFTLSPAEEFVMNNRYVVDGMLYSVCSDEDSEGRSPQLASYTSVEHEAGDSVLVGFMPDCVSCNVSRPSRSRHCRLCGTCVRRFDHHCPWINNDVAEGTHRYFLGFLIVHAISCTWAAVDLYCIIRQYLVSRGAWGWVLVRGSQRYNLTFVDYMAIIVNFKMLEGCLFFFAVCIGLVLYGFWAYQMSAVMRGVTMNDLNKIDDVAEFVSTLPTLDLVYREACKVRTRLQQVAFRKPSRLTGLQEPPMPMTAKGFEEGGRENKRYRKRVKKMLVKDLNGMFDKGIHRNIQEVLFPYAILTRENVAKAAKVISASM